MKDSSTAFIARIASYDIHDGAEEVRLSQDGEGEAWLSFRRRMAPADQTGEPGGEDRHIHVEFGPPAASADDIVDFCHLDPGLLHLKLEQPLNGMDDFRIHIDIPDPGRERLITGLKRIFADKAHLLTLADELL